MTSKFSEKILKENNLKTSKEKVNKNPLKNSLELNDKNCLINSLKNLKENPLKTSLKLSNKNTISKSTEIIKKEKVDLLKKIQNEKDTKSIIESNEKISINSPAYIFCKLKSEINKKNENGYTPIYCSIISNNLESLNELLKLGADPNIPNLLNETPLYKSIEMENYDALIILLQYNTNCNICKKNGNSPLHLATEKKKINFISALLRHGANPNLQNILFNQTPLHIAIINKCNQDILKIFFRFKADCFFIKDKFDKTPFDYAQNKDYQKLIENIFKKCNSVNENYDKEIFNNNTPKNFNDTIKEEEEDYVSSTKVFQSESNKIFSSGKTCNNITIFDNKNSEVKNFNNEDLNKEKKNIELLKDNFNNNEIKNEILNDSKIINNGIKEENVNKNNLNNKKEENNNIDNLNMQNSTEEDFLTKTNLNDTILNTTKKNISNTIKDNLKNNFSNSLKKINITEDTLNFNLTPRDDINNNLNDLFTTNSKKEKKDLNSEINPLDLVNQIITTNNSNIFSELNSKIEKKETLSDLSYSKSKSYIISENHNENNIKKNDKSIYSNLSIESNFDIKSENNNSMIKRNNIEMQKNLNYENKENYNPNINLINIKEDNSNIKKANIIHNNNNNNNNNSVDSYSKTFQNNRNSINSIKLNKTIIENHNNNNTSKTFQNKKLYNINSNNIYSLNTTRPSTQYNTNSIKNILINNINNNNKETLIINSNNNSLYNKVNCQNFYNKDSYSNNVSFSTFNTPFYNNKQNSFLNEYAFENGKWINNNLSNDKSYNEHFFIDQSLILKLKNWLISCNLINYLNLFFENEIFDIEKLIEGVKNKKINVLYKDIEDLGIKKPGHIFRFLLKVEIDCNFIDEKITNFIFNICNKNTEKKSLNEDLLFSYNDFKTCCNLNNKNVNSTNYDNVISFLESKNISFLKENLIHNGFDNIEYLLIQLFSKYTFNDGILTDCLHIYNEEYKIIFMKVLFKEKRKICKILNIPFYEKFQFKNKSLELNGENEENCELCNIF